MAEYTQNYNLKKPAEEDFYNVKDFNDNADIIDQALKAHDDALATKETPEGAQEKADAALNSAKQYTDQEVGEVAQELAAHKADYADLKTDYEKEATKFTIESDDTYDRETRPTVYYKKNGWVKLIYSITRIDGELMLRNEYLLRLPVGFRPKTTFVTLAVQCDLDIAPPFEKMTLKVYDTGELQVQENATKKIIHGEVVFYAGGGTV